MRKRPSRIAPGANRPWLIESDEVSQPSEEDDEGLRSTPPDARVTASPAASRRGGAKVGASTRLWGSALAEPNEGAGVGVVPVVAGSGAAVRPHIAQNRASA